MSESYSVEAILRANVSDFVSKVKQAESQMKGFVDKNAETFDSFKKVGAAATAGGALIVAGLAGAVKASSDFQSGFAGVRKTVDASEAEFKVLEQGIRNMAKELPATTTEISAVAEAAGQLGIKKENILAFTRTMIDLGEATNLTADEAATSFAQFANVVQMPQENFDRLGSTVVALGNSMATTEADIVSMAMRLAGTGAQVGLTEAEIMALAATMSSVGINAEAGGSAMSTVMKKISNAVSDGGKKMDLFAQAAGMSSEEFSTAWQNDPISALDSFIKGLAASGIEGENLNQILADLGIKGIQETDTLLRLAGASDLLGEAVDTAGTAWKENSALSDEAMQRYETLESKIAILKNTLLDIAVSIGNALLPAVTTMAEFIQGLAEKMSLLDEKTMTIIAVIATLAAGFLLLVGPILMLIGFIPSILAGWSALTTVLGTVAGALTFLTGPIAIAIAAIALISAALVIAYNKVEWFRDAVNEAWSGLAEIASSAFNSVKEAISTAISAVVEYVRSKMAELTSFWNENSAQISQATQNVWNVISAVIKAAMTVITAVVKVAFALVLSIVKMVWENIKGVIDGALNVIMGLVKAFAGLFTGDFKGMWDGVVQVFKGAIELVWNAVQLMLWGRMLKGIAVFAGSFRTAATSMWSGIQGVFTKAIELVKGVFTKGFQAMQTAGSTIMNAIRSVISSVWNGIKTVFSSAVNIVQSVFKAGFNAIKTVASTIMNAIKTVISTVWNAIKTVFSGSMSAIKNLVTSGFNLIKSTITTIMNAVKSLITSVWNAIKTVITTVVNAIKTAVTSAFNAIRSTVTSVMNAIRSLITSAWNAIKSIITSVMNAIKSVIQAGWNGVKSTITSAMSAIKSAITNGFNAVVNAIKSSMTTAVNTVKSMMSSMVSAVTGAAGKFLQAGKDLISGLISGIMSMASAAVEAVAGVVGGIVDKAKSMLKIKSPSRVFMGIGDDTMQGWINGMAKRQTDVSKVIKDTSLLMLDITDHYKSQEKEIIRKANSEIAQIEKRSQEDIDKIHRTAAAKKRKLTQDENIKIQRIKADANKKIAEIDRKATTDSVNLLAKEQADKLKELKLYVDNKKSLNQLSLDEEAAIWKQATTLFEEDTKERVDAQKRYQSAMQAIDKELMASIKLFVEDKKSLEQLSLKDEAEIWQAAAKAFQEGTKEKVEAQKEYAKALDKINKEITDTNKKYTDRMSKINEDFKKQEEDLTKKYQSSLEDRTKALHSFAGTFDEFDIKTEKSGQDLLKNLSGQVDGFKKWQIEIEALSKKAIDEGLIAELKAMGPKALGELMALNTLSESELTKYSDLYREKSELARTQAEAELIGMKHDTEKQLTDLRDIANAELSALQNDWQKEIKSITQATSEEFSSLEQIGVDAVSGLVEGMKSMHADLQEAAQALADTVLESVKDVLDIHSPSRAMKALGEFTVQGFIDGMEASSAVPAKTMDSIAKSITDRTKSLNDELAKLESQKNEDMAGVIFRHNERALDWEGRKISALETLEREYQDGSVKSEEEYLNRKERIQSIEQAMYADYYRSQKAIAEEYEPQIRGIRVASEWKTYEALKEALDKGRENNEFTALEEMRIWREAADSFTDGTFQKEEAVKNFAIAQAQAVEDLAKQRKDVQEKSNAELLAAEQQYAADVKAINDELIKQQEEVTAAYQKAVDDRAKTLVGFAGIFDEFKKQTEKSGDQLLDNLRGQVDGFKDWQASIAELSNRAIDEGLLEELRQMGPKAAGEIEALNKLTDEQLTEYSNLYREKQALAREQAEAELVGMKEDTKKQLESLRAEADVKLDELRKSFDAQIKEITRATNEELAKLEVIGREAGEGLLKGLTSQKSAIISEAQSIADGVNAALASIRNVDMSVSADMQGLSVPTYSGINTASYNDNASVGQSNSGGGGFNQTVIINSPQPTSPADNARLMKQNSRQLGQEWGLI